MIDAGLRRSHFATHSLGFPSQDGVGRAEIAKRSREQLSRYETLAWYDGTAERVGGPATLSASYSPTGRSAEGRLFRYRRFRYAANVEGLAERWGKSVFQLDPLLSWL